MIDLYGYEYFKSISNDTPVKFDGMLEGYGLVIIPECGRNLGTSTKYALDYFDTSDNFMMSFPPTFISEYVVKTGYLKAYKSSTSSAHITYHIFLKPRWR